MSSLHLTITSRDKVVFDGDVSSVTSENKKGLFDVLPNHENFISILSGNLKAVLRNGATQEFPLENAIVRVRNNRIEVFIGI